MGHDIAQQEHVLAVDLLAAVGEPLGRIYGYKTSHIIESEAQADAALYDSNSHGYRRSDGLSIAGRKDVGDYEWKNRAGSACASDSMIWEVL